MSYYDHLAATQQCLLDRPHGFYGANISAPNPACFKDMHDGTTPYASDEYSTRLFSRRAVDVRASSASGV